MHLISVSCWKYKQYSTVGISASGCNPRCANLGSCRFQNRSSSSFSFGVSLKLARSKRLRALTFNRDAAAT